MDPRSENRTALKDVRMGKTLRGLVGLTVVHLSSVRFLSVTFGGCLPSELNRCPLNSLG